MYPQVSPATIFTCPCSFTSTEKIVPGTIPKVFHEKVHTIKLYLLHEKMIKYKPRNKFMNM